MSLYRVTPTKLEAVSTTSFVAEKMLERNDLQRLLKQDISLLGDDLMVIAEEFGEWEDSSRRIDLLCLSRDASLVVVEIKRTEDGGHMDLQALRYASMVSEMTLEQVVQACARSRNLDPDVARAEVHAFTELEADAEKKLTGDVRIILVSANFSTELTTSVLWLNRRDLDITCIRLSPYKMGDTILIHSTQIIPLPESADYEVKLKAKAQEEKKVLTERKELLRKFWTQLIERARGRTKLFENRKPWVNAWLPAAIGRTGFQLNLSMTGTESKAELYVSVNGDADKSLAAYNALKVRKVDIENVFGGELDWQDLPDSIACRICTNFSGGWRLPESEWPQLQERMLVELLKLEKTFKKPVQDLNF